MNNENDSFDDGLNHTLGGEDEDFDLLNNEQITSYENSNDICAFCKQEDKEYIQPIQLRNRTINVHPACLDLSPTIKEDFSNIEAVLNIIDEQKCVCCDKVGASLTCSVCFDTYHVTCAGNKKCGLKIENYRNNDQKENAFVCYKHLPDHVSYMIGTPEEWLQALRASIYTHPCSVCGFNTQNGSDWIICSQCKMAGHKQCFGVVPETNTQSFICKNCQIFNQCQNQNQPVNFTCELCKINNPCLPVILSNNNKIYHTICSLCLPNATINDITNINGFVCPDEIQMNNSNIKCDYCQSSEGYIMKCSFPECQCCCHPSCGILNNQNVSFCTPTSAVYFCTIHCPLDLWCCCRKHNTDIFMIECDECHEWFHGECVCIGSNQLNEDEQYVCDKCKSGNEVSSPIQDFNENKDDTVNDNRHVLQQNGMVFDENNLLYNQLMITCQFMNNLHMYETKRSQSVYRKLNSQFPYVYLPLYINIPLYKELIKVLEKDNEETEDNKLMNENIYDTDVSGWCSKANKLSVIPGIYSYSYRKSSIQDAIDHLLIGEQNEKILHCKEYNRLKDCVDKTKQQINKLTNYLQTARNVTDDLIVNVETDYDNLQYSDKNFIKLLNQYKLNIWLEKAQYELLSEINFVNAKKLIRKANTLGIQNLVGEALNVYYQLNKFVQQVEDWQKSAKILKNQMDLGNRVTYEELNKLLKQDICESIPIKQKSFFTSILEKYEKWHNRSKKWIEILQNYSNTKTIPEVSNEEVTEFKDLYNESLQLKLDSQELILFEIYGKILCWIFRVMNVVKNGMSYNELVELQNQYTQFPTLYLPDKKYIDEVELLLNKVKNWVNEAKSVIENSETPLEQLEKLYNEYKELGCKYDIGTYITAQIEWLKEIKPSFGNKQYTDIKLGCYCWAKIGCYPWWPGFVPDSTPNQLDINMQPIEGSQLVYLFGIKGYRYIVERVNWDDRIKYNSTNIFTDFYTQALKEVCDFSSLKEQNNKIKHNLSSYPKIQCRSPNCHMPLFNLSQYCCFDCMESDIERKMNGLFNYKLVSSTAPLPKSILPENTKLETIHIVNERRVTRSSSSILNLPSPTLFSKKNRMMERGINYGIDSRTREKVRENLFNGLKIVNENEQTKTDEHLLRNLAKNMEEVLYRECQNYTDHIRVILHHLKDKKNQEFRLKLINKEILLSKLPTLSTDEMLSSVEYEKLKKEREEHMKANVVKMDIGEQFIAKKTDSGVELVKVGGNNNNNSNNSNNDNENGEDSNSNENKRKLVDELDKEEKEKRELQKEEEEMRNTEIDISLLPTSSSLSGGPIDIKSLPSLSAPALPAITIVDPKEIENDKMEEEGEEDNSENENDKGSESDNNNNNENDSPLNKSNEKTNEDESKDLFSEFLDDPTTEPKIKTDSILPSKSKQQKTPTPTKVKSILEPKWDNTFTYKKFKYYITPKLLFGPDMKNILPSPVSCIGRVDFKMLENHIEASVAKGKGVSLYAIEPEPNVRDKFYELSEQLRGKERAAIAEGDYRDHKLTVYIVPKLTDKMLREIPIIYRKGEKDSVHLLLIHNETERSKENISLIIKKVEDNSELLMLIDDIAYFIAQDPRREPWEILKRKDDKTFGFLEAGNEFYEQYQKALLHYSSYFHPPFQQIIPH